MALIRWTPARDPFAFQTDLNHLFDEVLGVRRGPDGPVVLHPAVDIEEHPEGFTIRTELPGMKLEDVKITFADNQLVIRGEKRREEEKKDGNFIRTERVYGQFERAFTLSQAVQPERISATYRDGVLEVSVPKAEEAKSREIPIKISQGTQS
jgi:HSP20 family protein